MAGNKPKKYRRIVLAATVASLLLAMNIASLWLWVFDPFRPEPFLPPIPPREYLAQECEKLGYDCVLLDTIAFCESSWQMVKNSSSSAFGYFQIIDDTERTTPQYADGERKYDPYTNINMALYLYGTRGANPWYESRGCWQRRYWQARATSQIGQ